jgi:hypothetical protein
MWAMTRPMTVRKFRLGEEPPARDEWRDHTPAQRMLEVERLRRVMKSLGGDPDVPMLRQVTGRRKLTR